MNEIKLKLRSPWVLYERQLWALFRHDPEVSVELDEGFLKVTLRTDTQKKADALSRLMPAEPSFGNVKVKLCIVPANRTGEKLPEDAPMIDILKAAFEGNEAVKEIRPVSKGLFRDLCYVVFENAVVQYEADNLADVNGNISTLYENIAREVMPNANGVFFCTSVRLAESNALDKPLGE